VRPSTIPGWLSLVAGAVGLLIIAGGVALAACGSSGTTASKLSLSISEQGKKASLQAPKSTNGGLVNLSFQNKGKAPHGVQLIRYTGNHTAADVGKQLSSNSDKTPEWLRAQGGTGTIPGGQSDTATLNLPAGNYVAFDAAAIGGSPSGPPASADIKVTSGDTGDLPSTPATVDGAKTGKDKYAWNISGLKSGRNEITFKSGGSDAIHLIGAVPVKGKAPSLGQVKEDFSSNGPPPPYLDVQNAHFTAVLDGGSSQTLNLDLKPGKYIFFCPLTDRDGGKPHDQEGMLKYVTIK
jgi:hypothetical protein